MMPIIILITHANTLLNDEFNFPLYRCGCGNEPVQKKHKEQQAKTPLPHRNTDNKHFAPLFRDGFI